MKWIAPFLFLCTISCMVNAQPQIAVTTPSSGITKIVPSLDSALTISSNGDYIYMPGGTFSLNKYIDKSVHIIGAGHYPDSTLSTNPTIITAPYNFRLIAGSDGSSLEGLKILNPIYFGTSLDNQRVQNINIKRCNFSQIYFSFDNGNSYSSSQLCQRITLEENIFDNLFPFGCNALEVNIYKNIVHGEIGECPNSVIKNNIFFGHFPGSNQMTGNHGGSNVTYENNIFLSDLCNPYWGCPTTVGNIINNNLFTSSPHFGISTITNNNIITNISDVFINYLASNNGDLTYKNDFRLSPKSNAQHLGTDGTDLGIYGTTNPSKFGGVPSNPHISFKNVDSKTTSNGILNATFKVIPQIY